MRELRHEERAVAHVLHRLREIDVTEFRTGAARALAARSPGAAEAIRRIVAARVAIPLTDDQIATLRRCLPPVEHAERPAA